MLKMKVDELIHSNFSRSSWIKMQHRIEKQRKSLERKIRSGYIGKYTQLENTYNVSEILFIFWIYHIQ